MDPKFWIFLSIVWGCNGSKNHPPEAPSDETECTRRMNYLRDNYLNTQIIMSPQLTGKWVSEKCEVRTGPLYMLRSYTFFPNETFYLLQYFYTDDSCSSISHVVSIKGTYKFKDTYSNSKLNYKATRISITPHDNSYIQSLRSRISSSCPKEIGKYWRTFNEYVIQDQYQRKRDYHQPDDNKEPLKSTISYPKSIEAPLDSKCLSSLNISYDELSILRVQRRPAMDGKKLRYELLLGSSYQEKGRRATLLKFQLPLILLNETNDCFLLCKMLSSSTHMHVPHLTAIPILPLFFNGHWISQTCEPRSNTMYTIRSYRFNQFSSMWKQETAYYSDFSCSHLLMTHTTIGNYSDRNMSEVVYGAMEIDFEVKKSYLSIADQNILDTIENDPECGIAYYWKLNVKKEIPSRRGCSSIGLANPVIRNDIIKLDMDYFNGSGNETSYILQLGDEGSADLQNPAARPTAFEAVLMQCDSEPQEIIELVPDPSSAVVKYSNFYFVFCILLVAMNL